ncbi:MAG: recombinase family protein [Actinomycetota bacterium]|nr:recombinase family protein [Actinomycetota bacterium]
MTPSRKLLTQVQGVIAEYERAKITERNRRGRLWRARAGEVITWKAPFGYRRVPRVGDTAAHLVICEPEAVVVRRVFADYVAGGYSVREITRRLNADGIASPSGRPAWSTSAISNLLRNESYVGRLYFNRTIAAPDPRPGRPPRQVPRPKDEWIAIPVPPIISDDLFEAATKTSTGNAVCSALRARPGVFLLRGLVRCGVCGIAVACHQRPVNLKQPDGAWTATTTAATTTPSEPAARSTDVPNVASAPTPSTTSSSTKSAKPSPAPRSSWQARRPWPAALPHPTTNSSRRN